MQIDLTPLTIYGLKPYPVHGDVLRPSRDRSAPINRALAGGLSLLLIHAGLPARGMGAPVALGPVKIPTNAALYMPSVAGAGLHNRPGAAPLPLSGVGLPAVGVSALPQTSFMLSMPVAVAGLSAIAMPAALPTQAAVAGIPEPGLTEAAAQDGSLNIAGRRFSPAARSLAASAAGLREILSLDSKNGGLASLGSASSHVFDAQAAKPPVGEVPGEAPKADPSCPFCNDVWREMVIAETEDYFVKPTKGMLGVEGYTLLVSKQHWPSYGHMTQGAHARYAKMAADAIAAVRTAYGNPVIFEHGVTGQSIKHAHLHIIPGLDFDRLVEETEKALRADAVPYSIVKKELGLNDAFLEKAAAVSSTGGYLYIADPSRGRAVVFRVAPDPRLSMLLRKTAGTVLGRPELADWKKVRESNVLAGEDELLRERSVARLRPLLQPMPSAVSNPSK